MTEIVNGLALYNLEDLTVQNALHFADKFFKDLKIKPNSIYYLYTHAPDKKGETVSAMDISFDELKLKTNNGLIDNFIIQYCSTERLWDIGFTFSAENSIFGERINYIEIQFLDKLLKIENQIINNLLSAISLKTKITYGIGYQLQGSIAKAYSYALCFDLSTIYDFENSSEWLYQLPSRTNDVPQYPSKLRMVYIINLLNLNHLNLDVYGKTLKDWILSDYKNGSLKELNNQSFLWNVSFTELERVNKTLGEAGILISWFPAKPILNKKLP